MDYSILLSSVETVLGKSHKRARHNYAFNCPFCNHRKPKLEVLMITDENGQNPWECWVCHTRGRTIKSLLRQLRVPKEQAQPILSLIRKGEKVFYEVEEALTLPEEYQPLWEASPQSVIANKIKQYLYNRGLSDYEIKRYRIGYCTSGDYSGRIIVPSYDENNTLNFFTGRTYEDSYYKYKNPSTSRDLIFFENSINWELPLVLVEGPFDAMAVKRNAVPILGKTLSKSLIKKIIVNKVKDIYIALDKDALKEAITFCKKFLDMGINVFMVDMDDKDPSDMGFVKITEKIKQAQNTTYSDLMRYKLSL